MARTVKQWRKEVEAVLSAEGIADLVWSYTGSTHQRVSGKITVAGGRVVPVTLTCSLSPSDHRAAHRVKSDARAMLRAARAMT